MQPDALQSALDAAAASLAGTALPAPRWEWRVFSRGATWQKKLAAYLTEPPDSAVADTYLLSARSKNDVRMREHHIDVREARRVTPDGIEFWRNTMRLECPLGARQLADLFRAWGLDEPGPMRPCWSVRQFERDIIDPRPALLSLPVIKRRTPFDVHGCAAEHVNVLVIGESWESVAVKDADEAKVREAVTALGLGDLANTGYPAALRAIAGLTGTDRHGQPTAILPGRRPARRQCDSRRRSS